MRFLKKNTGSDVAEMNTSIAIIDDSPTVRKILEVCLRRAGYNPLSFADGSAFLRWLMTPQAHIPALVLVDLLLPTMDGYTLIRHLKAKPAFAQTVFVILSGRAGILDKLKGRLSGAQVYLTKPFRTADILATVHTCIGSLLREPTTEMKGAAYH
jgi:twitching motility two-component system response regulator PilG